MNSDFGGVLSPIFRSEYGQSIQMQYICVSFLAKSQLRERGVCCGRLLRLPRDARSLARGPRSLLSGGVNGMYLAAPAAARAVTR